MKTEGGLDGLMTGTWRYRKLTGDDCRRTLNPKS